MMSSEKSIIILATGPSFTQCDFKGEVWGVNGAYTTPNAMPENLKQYFHMEKLFITDSLFCHDNTEGTLNFDIEKINEFKQKYSTDIITLHSLRLGKHKLNSRPFPYKRVCEYFSTEYFTDTICYMLSYALYAHSYPAQSPQGIIRPELKCPLRLRLFGVDMVTTREYQQSKGGVEHWLGWAMAMGCQVENSRGSTIMALPMGYPYGQHVKAGKEVKKQMDTLDPFGFMKGKNPSTAEMEKIIEGIKDEPRTTNLDFAGDKNDNCEQSIHNS